MIEFTAAVGIILLVILLYLYGISTYNYWKKQGIPYVKPKYPFLGNLYKATFGIQPKSTVQNKIYSKFKNEKFIGVFNFTIPQLLITDPALIEQILIKEFQTFPNRFLQPEKKINPLGMHLLNLEVTQWKMLRKKLVPTFSKIKLKNMFDQINQPIEGLIKLIDNNFSDRVDMKETMSSLILDVIGSCAFGLEIDSINNPNVKVKEIARKVANLTGQQIFFRRIRSFYPNLLKFLKLQQHSLEVEIFFYNLIKSTAEYREKNNIRRNDYFQSLMDLRKQYLEVKKNDPNELIFDDAVFISNVYIFIVAAYETTSSVLTFLLFELSRNQDIQEKLYEHIKTVLERYNGQITFDAVNDMPYLNQAINETLRLYALPELVRISSKSYQIPDTDIILPKGTTIIIPLQSIHRDEKYFLEPEKFEPERFSKENMNKIIKGTYQPFGDGPRICIGASFARLVMYTTVVKLLLKYKFTLNSKTKIPLNYTCSPTFTTPKDNIWLNLERRVISG